MTAIIDALIPTNPLMRICVIFVDGKESGVMNLIHIVRSPGS